jgi:hypothetical protein
VREHGQGVRWVALERSKPKGASGCSGANRVAGGEGLSEGSKPRSRGLPVRPEDSSNGVAASGTAGGSVAGGNIRGTFRVGKAPKGEIPGALSARNRAGAGPGGASRQEGGQTLKAERSGSGKPAVGGPPSLERAEGNESPGEVRAALSRQGGRLGATWKDSGGRRNSKRGSVGFLNGIRPASGLGRP